MLVFGALFTRIAIAPIAFLDPERDTLTTGAAFRESWRLTRVRWLSALGLLFVIHVIGVLSMGLLCVGFLLIGLPLIYTAYSVVYALAYSDDLRLAQASGHSA
jgi:uncharacterized membrane protein